ncbi:MAG TPA: 50S ribosomal protein L11 [Planctomycetaceae bacterium]|nr:50S ribosomal protein L11 [Planctomycetaceae bacterium]HIQ20677.1 50S ribosomal protein L11 [Planctomycetota bacterium]
MAKQLVASVKLHVRGGQATPAPPVGTALGRFGINLGQFVQQFNERTKDDQGLRVPVVVRVYNDRSFEMETKSPVAADLLKQAAGIAKGAHTTPRDKVGSVTRSQLEQIVQRKVNDLNARDLDHARRIIEGTARSMGLEVVEG